MKSWCAFVLLLLSVNAVAQPADDSLRSRQCSLLRELLYHGQQHFAGIKDVRLRGSQGYRPHGAWRFSNEHFSTTLPWPGARLSQVEHSTDERDTSATDSWQYLAWFAETTDALAANTAFVQITTQINGCTLPLNDSVTIQLAPIPPAELVTARPADDLLAAYLSDLGRTADGASLALMVGLQRTRRAYQPVLILEWLLERRR